MPLPSVAAVTDIHVEAPPAVPRRADAGAARLVPVALGVASAGASLALLTSRPAGSHGPALIVFPLLMLLSAAAALSSGGAGRWRADLDADRRRYLRYLDSLWERLADDAAAQRDRLLDRNPAPDDLWALPRQRWWDRDRAAPDFGAVRVGLGPVLPATRVVGPPDSGSGEPDPVTTVALARLVRAHGPGPEAPVTVGLAEVSIVVVTGPVERARALVRAMICQLAVAHSPAEVTVAAVVSGRAAGAWEWLKWLPHQPDRTESTGRLHLTVLDGADGTAPGPVIRIVPADSGLVVEADGTAVALTRPDELSAAGALALARRLAGHPQPRRGDWLSRLDPEHLWDNDTGALRGIPIGTDGSGVPLELDIREAAAGGIGPHGLCVGATGSGKSELLRTIALGMIARHPPATVNLILIDFKGGATFLDLARAPHTTAVVTNLDEEAHLVDRMREALTGEIDRRQRLLRAAGNLSAAAELPGLPALFIIVDEFSEMLSRHPEFADVFVAIGRLGRSLGMHLLLASQRLEEGRLRGLDSHLSYRICLKTLSESESRMVIGVPAAHHLPARPGAGYLKAGAADPVPFHAAYVSAPVPASPRTPGGPRLFTAHDTPGPGAVGPTLLRTVLDSVARAAAGGPAPHPVWLPPLTETPALAALLSGHPQSGLRIPVGVVDRVYEHRRDPLVLDLCGADGNVAVVGGPRSGKSTAARTVVTALAGTHSPRRARVYCLDFGGALTDLAGLPHVGVVAPGTDADLVRRTVTDVLGLLRRREAGDGSAAADGAVFLVVDGWGSARRDYRDFEELESALGILGGGLAHGIHLVVTAGRWADIRPALRDQLGTRIELRLGDPADSEIDRARAAAVPRDRPGHGLSPDGLPMVLARPGASHREESDGWRVPPVRLLPAALDYRELLAQAGAAAGPVVGVDEDRLEPVGLDLSDQHLLVFGEPGCGKTAVLRLLCHEIARTAADAHLVVLDPRGTLSGFGGTGLQPLAPLLALLRDRVSGEKDSTTPVFLIVDDYGLAAQALTPLAEMLPHARDIGLRVAVARGSGGAARALYDPVLGALRESGPMGLQLSAAPEDGPLLGAVRPRPMPPGRAVFVSRAGADRTVQVAWTEPA